MTGLVDKRRAVDIFYTDFSKAFSALSQDPYREIVQAWTEWEDRQVNTWNSQGQGIVINGLKST